MSEAWQTGLFTAFVTVAITVLGYIATVIRDIRRSMDGYVRDKVCDDKMGNHCAQLSTLQSKVDNNTMSIAVLQTEIKHIKDNTEAGD